MNTYKQNIGKMSLLAIGIASVSSYTYSDYILRVPTKEKFSSWSGVSPIITSWTNAGNQFNCSSWSPEQDSVDFGLSYLQSQSCDQRQQRTITPREKDNFSGEIKELTSNTENRVIQTTNNRTSVGTRRNWVSTEADYSTWQDTGLTSNYEQWLPEISNQMTDFNQSRRYKMAQTRMRQNRERDTVTGDIRDIGAAIEEHQQALREEQRTVNVSSSAYRDVGIHYDCSEWTPDSDTVDFGEAFTQSRICKQNQSRNWLYETENETSTQRIEHRTINETMTQETVGTHQEWVSYDSEFTDWENDGQPYQIAPWTPAASNQKSTYVQSRSYQQNQIRLEQLREQDQISGQVRNAGNPIQRSRTVSLNESRTITVTASNWLDVGGHYDCDAWSPEESTVDWGQNYTQSRSCKQNQSRDYLHKTGSQTIHRTPDHQTINENENRDQVGQRQMWINHSSTFTEWINEGAPYNHSSWSPSSYDQTAAYSQTRSFKQDQSRMEQRREIDSISGQIRNNGTPLKRIKTLTKNESRNVTVQGTTWTNIGVHYQCGTWSPDRSTVDWNVSFTQTRSCKQNQGYDYLHKVGGKIEYTHGIMRTVNENETRTSTGTKTVIVGASSSYTPWSTYNTVYGSWSPAANTQTSSYSQSRTRTFHQERYEQKRQIRNGSVENIGSPIRHTRTTSGSNQSRNVGVTNTGWKNNGSATNYSSWSPTSSNQTSNYTQTRTYTQPQKVTYTHKVGSTTIKTHSKTRNLANQSQSRVISVTAGNLYYSASYHSCGNCTPATSTVTNGQTFTQTRDCKRNRYRKYTHSHTGHVHTKYIDAPMISKAESRQATGTKAGFTLQCRFTENRYFVREIKTAKGNSVGYYWNGEAIPTPAFGSNPYIKGDFVRQSTVGTEEHKYYKICDRVYN